MLLKFSPGIHNAKLKKLEKRLGQKVYTFSLMSGHTCPYAKECKSMAVEGPDGKWHIEDGPDTQFRCFSASQDVLFPGLRNQRQNNTKILELAAKPAGDILAGEWIINAIPKNAEIVRVHVGGDFKTQAYFDAWCYVARCLPLVTFYAYTKSLPFWVKRIDRIPANFHLTASYGGHRDDLIAAHNLRFSKVVKSNYEARKLGLTVDHDDSHAAGPGPSFALLVHGTQPKGGKYAKAARKNRKAAQ
jgi:hypothetical protein